MMDEFDFSCVGYLEDADEDIAECGDGGVILDTDDFSIYDGIEDKGGGRPTGRHPLRLLRHR